MQITATLIIIVLTCVISLIAFYQEGLMEDLAMYPYELRTRRQYYRFLTSGFVHADWMHLLFNMYSFYWVGIAVESIFVQISSWRYMFPLYYGLGIVVSSIPYYFRHRFDPNRLAVGASGAVSACIFSIILIDPWAPIGVLFIPMRLIVYGILFLAISAYMARRDSGTGGGIAHGVHFWGAVYGFVFPIILEPSLFTSFIQKLLSPILR